MEIESVESEIILTSTDSISDIEAQGASEEILIISGGSSAGTYGYAFFI